jgi:hypothetical protein
MHERKFRFITAVALIAFSYSMTYCSGSNKQRPEQPSQNTTASTTQAAAPVSGTQSTSDSASNPGVSSQSKPTGTPASEKHELRVTNYSKVPVVATLNGEWLGQWNQSTSVPLQPVFQGKNQLTIELQGKPDGACTIEVVARRGEQDVKLLSLDLSGQTGTHTYIFSAK